MLTASTDKLPREQRVQALAQFGCYPKSTYTATPVIKDIHKGIPGNFPWNTVVNFKKAATELCYAIDSRFYMQQFCDRYPIQHHRSHTTQPCVVFIQNTDDCPVVPHTRYQATESGAALWPVKVTKECLYWRQCSLLTPAIHPILLSPSPDHTAYYRILGHKSQQWSRQYPLTYLEPRNLQAYPGGQVRESTIRVAIDSWLVAYIDVTMAEAFHKQTSLVPQAGGGLRCSRQSLDTAISQAIMQACANYFTHFAEYANIRAKPPYDLRRINFNKFKYYAHVIYPGVVMATTPMWLEASEVFDRLLYFGE